MTETEQRYDYLLKLLLRMTQGGGVTRKELHFICIVAADGEIPEGTIFLNQHALPSFIGYQDQHDNRRYTTKEHFNPFTTKYLTIREWLKDHIGDTWSQARTEWRDSPVLHRAMNDLRHEGIASTRGGRIISLDSPRLEDLLDG